MEKHSVYSPSQLSRIIKCPGSVALYEALGSPKKKTNEAAEHGTMLHDVMHQIHKHNLKSLKQFDISIDDKGMIKDCVDYYKSVITSIGHCTIEVYSEKPVSLQYWGLPEVFGTMDCGILDLLHRRAHIFDWKFGYTFVDAQDNDQLFGYAAGFISYPTLIKQISMHIVQPAIDNFSVCTISTEELFNWVHQKLAIAIQQSRSTSPTFNPGQEQCQWCPCVRYCNYYMAWVNEKAADIFSLNGLLPDSATHQQIIDLLDKAYIVEKAIKTYYKALYDDLSLGAYIPGKKLVEGRSNRSWKDEQKAIKWLEENAEIDEMFVAKFISPAQAEKLDKSIKKMKEFQELYEKKPGNFKMVDESDPRPAYTTDQHATKVFEKFKAPNKLD